MKSFIIILLLLIGCQEKTEPINLKPMTLSEAYPGDISEVDKIELLDGTSGNREVVKDQKVIEEWINKVKDIELTPDDNQEARVGYIYGISLFVGEELKLGFIPNHINEIYYKTNDEFIEHLESIFEQQLGSNSK